MEHDYADAVPIRSLHTGNRDRRPLVMTQVISLEEMGNRIWRAFLTVLVRAHRDLRPERGPATDIDLLACKVETDALVDRRAAVARGFTQGPLSR